MKQSVDAEEYFHKHIPDYDQDEVLCRIIECAIGCQKDDQVDVCNVEWNYVSQDSFYAKIGGFYEYNGETFHFEIEDGNINGTVILSWELEESNGDGFNCFMASLNRIIKLLNERI